MQEPIRTFSPFGPLIHLTKVDPKYVEELLGHIESVRGEEERDYAGNLAGRIHEQYTVEDKTSDTCKNHILRHAQTFTHESGMQPQPLQINGLWVNIQKEMEVNPMHAHDGMLSFVLYIKNDLTRAETINNKFDKAGDKELAGILELHYGEEQFLNWSKYYLWPEVGDLIIFPSWLRHFVYPHYEEGKERISVAGNINPFINEG